MVLDLPRLLYQSCLHFGLNQYKYIPHFIFFLSLLILTISTIVLALKQKKIIYNKNLIFISFFLLSLIAILYNKELFLAKKYGSALSGNKLFLIHPSLVSKIVLFIFYLLILKQALILIPLETLEKIIYATFCLLAIGVSIICVFFDGFSFNYAFINKNWFGFLSVILTYTGLIRSQYKWYLKHIILWCLVFFLAVSGARHSLILSITCLPLLVLKKRWIFYGLVLLFLLNINKISHISKSSKLNQDIIYLKQQGPSYFIKQYKEVYLYRTNVFNKKAAITTHNFFVEIYRAKNVVIYCLILSCFALMARWNKASIGLCLIWLCYFPTITTPLYFFVAFCAVLLKVEQLQNRSLEKSQ